MKRLASAVAAALLIACASSTPLPAPEAVSSDPGPSSITLSVSLPLADAQTAIEREVPRRIEKTSGYEISPDGRFGLQYIVERDPVSLTANQNTIRTSLRFRYAVRACYRTALGGKETFWPCVSCGFGEPLREAMAALESKLQWDPALFVRSTTAPGNIDFLDRCRVSGLRVDVTDWQVRPFIESQMAAAIAQLDPAIRAHTSVGRDLSAIWRSLQEPVQIAPGSWFVLGPQSLRFGALTGDAAAVRTTVTLVAFPRVVVGARPATGTAPMPRPTFGSVDDPRLRVTFAVELAFAQAETLLAGDPKRRFTIARGDKGGVVLISEEYRITGTPRVEPAAGTITIPDLEYELRDGRRFLDWFRHGAVRASLRKRATLDLKPTLEKFRTGLEQSLRSRGIEARVSSIEPASIVTLEDHFVITVVATGSAEMRVSSRR